MATNTWVLSIYLAALAIPGIADPAMFHQIRNKDTVVLVLPAGECDARVVGRKLDRITLKLKKESPVCGKRNALMEVSSPDVRDVVNNQRRRQNGRDETAVCAGNLIALIGVPAAVVIGNKTESSGAAWAILGGSAVGASFLCRQSDAQFTIYADQIAAARP